MNKYTLIVGLFLFTTIQAEIVLNGDKLEANFTEQTLESALTEISEQTGIEIKTYQSLDDKINVGYKDISVENLLSRLLSKHNTMYIRNEKTGDIKKIRIFSGKGSALPSATLNNEGKAVSGSIAVKKDNGFYITLVINGVPIPMLVDTGANVLSISQQVANQLKLVANKKVNVNTAGGKTVGGSVDIASVEMAGFKIENVKAIILPNLQETGLIGQNILQYYKRIATEDKITFSPLAQPEQQDETNSKKTTAPIKKNPALEAPKTQ